MQKLGALEESRHHVLRALLEAPRYREAHQLLLELAADEGLSEAAEEEEPTETDGSSSETSEGNADNAAGPAVSTRDTGDELGDEGDELGDTGDESLTKPSSDSDSKEGESE